MVRNLLVMQETRFQSLGWNDALERTWLFTPGLLPGLIPWTETGRLQSMGLQRLRHDWVTFVIWHGNNESLYWKQSMHLCSNDFQLGHFTYVDQWAEVGMGLSHNLTMYCKIPLTLWDSALCQGKNIPQIDINLPWVSEQQTLEPVKKCLSYQATWIQRIVLCLQKQQKPD